MVERHIIYQDVAEPLALETPSPSSWLPEPNQPRGDSWARKYSLGALTAVTLALVIQPPPPPPSMDSWFHPLSEPTREGPVTLAGEFAIGSKSVIYPDSWLRQFSEPVWVPPRPTEGQPFYVDDFVPEELTLDKWYQPLSEPLPAPKLITSAESALVYFEVAAEEITLDKWYRPLSEPLFAKEQVRLGEATTDPDLLTQPEAVHVQWLRSFSEPVFTKHQVDLGWITDSLEPIAPTGPATELLSYPGWVEVPGAHRPVVKSAITEPIVVETATGPATELLVYEQPVVPTLSRQHVRVAQTTFLTEPIAASGPATELLVYLEQVHPVGYEKVTIAGELAFPGYPGGVTVEKWFAEWRNPVWTDPPPQPTNVLWAPFAPVSPTGDATELLSYPQWVEVPNGRVHDFESEPIGPVFVEPTTGPATELLAYSGWTELYLPRPSHLEAAVVVPVLVEAPPVGDATELLVYPDFDKLPVSEGPLTLAGEFAFPGNPPPQTGEATELAAFVQLEYPPERVIHLIVGDTIVIKARFDGISWLVPFNEPVRVKPHVTQPEAAVIDPTVLLQLEAVHVQWIQPLSEPTLPAKRPQPTNAVWTPYELKTGPATELTEFVDFSAPLHRAGRVVDFPGPTPVTEIITVPAPSMDGWFRPLEVPPKSKPRAASYYMGWYQGDPGGFVEPTPPAPEPPFEKVWTGTVTLTGTWTPEGSGSGSWVAETEVATAWTEEDPIEC